MIFLTGSYVTGYYTEGSDIDIFIIFSDNVDFPEIKGLKRIGKYIIVILWNTIQNIFGKIERGMGREL